MNEVRQLSKPSAYRGAGMDREIKHPPWHWTKWPLGARVGVSIGLAVAVVLITVAVVFSNTERTVRLAASNVTVAMAQRGAFHDLIPLRGTVVALSTVY